MKPPTSKKEVATWKELPHKDQLLVLVLARLVEPLVQTSIQAYMFYQLRSFNDKLPDSTISYQAGILQASFSGAQTVTGWMWGRAADTYGRKTVLLFGSLGTLISCLGYGFSQSFVAALSFRILAGAVNGNIPVMRCMVSEIVKEKKHQARAFLLMPMCFNIGVILGPLLGGLLADPAGTYPRLFGAGTALGGENGVGWMIKFPYLLPNLASAAVVGLNIFLISFFLHETLDGVPDYLILPKLYLQRAWAAIRGKARQSTTGYSLVPESEQDIPLMTETERIAADPEAQSPKQMTVVEVELAKPKEKPAKLPFRRIWTPNVLFTLLAHFATAFHLGTFNSLWFTFLSANRYEIGEKAGYEPHGPFVFTGGLALPPAQVGTAMAIIGVIGITLQILIYPKANDKYGVLPLYRTFVYGFPLAYLVAPYLAIAPSSTSPPHPAGGPFVWLALCFVLLIFVVARTFVLPATMILINNSSPHPSVLGTVHGVAQSVGSAARTLGPAVAGYLFGLGLDFGVVGMAWWILALAGAFAVVTSLFVREGTGHEIKLEGDERRQEQAKP